MRLTHRIDAATCQEKYDFHWQKKNGKIIDDTLQLVWQQSIDNALIGDLNLPSARQMLFYQRNLIRGHSITGQDKGGVGQKMSVFVHAKGVKTVHAGGGAKK